VERRKLLSRLGRDRLPATLIVFNGEATMRGLALGIAIFLAGMRLSSAVEGQIDARTLCPVAISAFDGKDATQMQEFIRFVQNVFDELDAESREKGEPALKAKLIDTRVEGLIILGHCRQHPTETVYDAIAVAYRSLKLLRKHTIDDPVVQPHPTEGTSRFR
jgi:hypothetical protein